MFALHAERLSFADVLQDILLADQMARLQQDPVDDNIKGTVFSGEFGNIGGNLGGTISGHSGANTVSGDEGTELPPVMVY